MTVTICAFSSELRGLFDCTIFVPFGHAYGYGIPSGVASRLYEENLTSVAYVSGTLLMQAADNELFVSSPMTLAKASTALFNS